jgi:hypothetical protein
MLMSGIRDKHRFLCQQKLSELASQLSPIEMKLGPPFARIFQEKPSISCPVVTDEVVALREMIKGELKKVLDEAHAADIPKIRFGGVREGIETEYWRPKPFDPRVGICIRRKDEEEEIVNRILEEVEEKYPDGLGSLRATGLGLYWPRRGWPGAKTEPGSVLGAVEIPFSGSEPEG